MHLKYTSFFFNLPVICFTTVYIENTFNGYRVTSVLFLSYVKYHNNDQVMTQNLLTDNIIKLREKWLEWIFVIVWDYVVFYFWFQ